MRISDERFKYFLQILRDKLFLQRPYNLLVKQVLNNCWLQLSLPIEHFLI